MKAGGKVLGVPVLASIMNEASEERRRKVTDMLRSVYVIVFVPTCGQNDILALKFHGYYVAAHVTTEFNNISHFYKHLK